MMRTIVAIACLGLVVLAGCSLAPSEEDVRLRVRSELDTIGLDWVEVDVENRVVRLGGFAPQLGGGGLAVRTAEEAMCRTVLGVVPCATEVSADFGRSLADTEAWPRVQATVALGVLTLSGTVPDDASRLAAREAAGEAIRSGKVERYEDALVAQQVLPRHGSQALVKRLTRALAHCRDGGAVIEDGRVSMDCRLRVGDMAAVRRMLATPLPAGELIALELEGLPVQRGAEDTVSR